MKYLIREGYIGRKTGKKEYDIWFVSGKEIIDLAGLNPAECKIVGHTDIVKEEGYIEVFPSLHNKYITSHYSKKRKVASMDKIGYIIKVSFDNIKGVKRKETDSKKEVSKFITKCHKFAEKKDSDVYNIVIRRVQYDEEIFEHTDTE